MIYSENTTFASTPLLSMAIFEISLNLIHPSPFLYGESSHNQGYTFRVYNSSVGYYVNYEVNDIIVVICVCIKSYYMIKQVFLALEYNSNKMQRLV